jgi:hypothetical protein
MKAPCSARAHRAARWPSGDDNIVTMRLAYRDVGGCERKTRRESEQQKKPPRRHSRPATSRVDEMTLVNYP